MNHSLDAQLRLAVVRRDLDLVISLAWERHYGEMMSFLARNGVTEEAEDVVQDTFARVVHAWPTFEGERFSGWLFTLLRYQMLSARNARRRGADRRRGLPADLVTDCPAADEALAAAGIANVVDAALAGLDPVSACIAEALTDDITDAELSARILARTGEALSPPAICARRHRLRSRLVNLLKARGIT